MTRTEHVRLSCEWCNEPYKYEHGKFGGHDVDGWTMLEFRHIVSSTRNRVCPECTEQIKVLREKIQGGR